LHAQKFGEPAGSRDLVCGLAPIHRLIKEIEMPRNKLGQFEPGTCGNPRGRPRKLPRKIHPDRLRKDFFEISEILVPVIENGRRKLIPASQAIDKQLLLKAASGDLKAILEWNRMRDKHTLEYVKQQHDCMEQLLKSEAIVRKFPEDVTDDYKLMTRRLRALTDPDYLP
jgi:Family of unknown function (DUF5681)